MWRSARQRPQTMATVVLPGLVSAARPGVLARRRYRMPTNPQKVLYGLHYAINQLAVDGLNRCPARSHWAWQVQVRLWSAGGPLSALGHTTCVNVPPPE